jgi:protein-tyrosine kinase
MNSDDGNKEKYSVIIPEVESRDVQQQLEKKFLRWFPRLTPSAVTEKFDHFPVTISNLTYRTAVKIRDELQMMNVSVELAAWAGIDSTQEKALAAPEESKETSRPAYFSPRLRPNQKLEDFFGSSYLTSFVSPNSASAEAFRTLRTNLQFLRNTTDVRSLLITSSNEGEGKSTVATNIAIAMAQTNAPVLLIDSDLRRPNLHKAFGYPNTIGFSNILAQQATLEQCLITSFIPNLTLLLSGPIPRNPSELLSLPATRVMLDDAKKKFELVIIDSPPIASVTDSMIISNLVDGCYIVLNAGKTSRKVAQYTIESLRNVNANILGLVLNKFVFESHYYYRSYYHYTSRAD